jgi:hypothetical protein
VPFSWTTIHCNLGGSLVQAFSVADGNWTANVLTDLSTGLRRRITLAICEVTQGVLLHFVCPAKEVIDVQAVVAKLDTERTVPALAGVVRRLGIRT